MKKQIICIFSIVCLLVSYAGIVSAAGTVFMTRVDKTFLYMDKKVVSYNYDGETISFRLQPGGKLILTNASGSQTFLRFSAYDGSEGGVGYSIRPIYSVNPSNTFYEINADAGAHAQNVGYWVIGKKDGKWVNYVTIDSLAAVGYTAHEWHRIGTEINSNGEFLVTSSHEYMPTGAQYGYQRQMAVDARFQLFWDNNAEWFGIKCI